MAFGKKFSVAYSTSFGTITRQSVSLQLLNNTFSAGSNSLYYGSALPAGGALNGTKGFSLTLELRP